MPAVDNIDIQAAGPGGPALLQDIWLIEKMARSAVGKQTSLFAPTSAPTAYGVIE